MKNKKSYSYYKQALTLMPAGVNSPVRAFTAVGGTPVFIDRGKGSRIYDVDDNAYIDYVLSWGPLILGHAHKEVVSAIRQAALKGTSFGAPTKAETQIAEIIVRAFPSVEKVRLVNSGTEAVMSAIRLARSFTKKNKIIKFEGCYHGHSDALLVKAGSGLATFGVPSSSGVPLDCARNTLVLPYNNIDAVRSAVRSGYKDIAAVVLEPVCGNMGVVLPRKNFLSDLRSITQKYRVLLIFDEVITGFRFCFGGSQKVYNVPADITCLGKIIGGGMPIGAYGARQEIMDCAAPLGSMYQAGTLSGNPLAVACGLKTLQILRELDYNRLSILCEGLCRNIEEVCRSASIDARVNRIGSMFTLFFTTKEVFDYRTACACDLGRYAAFFRAVLEAGVYMAPAQFEANFLSFAHTDKDIERTVRVMGKALKKIGCMSSEGRGTTARYAR
ncbi:MAG: glutamate-1-semialdehyde 2,1-aminomutase [Candidatus Omnitrophica bacterium]|nr:glutamate-1-semialdehyde 2,1-aminomutase [Candidatus Omnitrophota bacterium]MCG2703416.1 glutamate-1-semialdehyde 2,1-aminomutase [Candidatus Omnitrophota bacterium]